MKPKFNFLINATVEERRTALSNVTFKYILKNEFLTASNPTQHNHSYLYISLYQACKLASMVSKTVLDTMEQKQRYAKKMLSILDKAPHGLLRWNPDIVLDDTNAHIAHYFKQTPSVSSCVALSVYQHTDDGLAKYLPPYDCIVCLSLVLHQDDLHDFLDASMMLN